MVDYDKESVKTILSRIDWPFVVVALTNQLSPTMKTVDIRYAKAHLSKLIEDASKGEPFIIAKAGKPVVRVTALSAPTGAQVRRLGFMAGQFSVPDDFDRLGADEIEGLFNGGGGK